MGVASWVLSAIATLQSNIKKSVFVCVISPQAKKYRTVQQFQFTSWPDHGVPEFSSSVIDFVRKARNHVEVQHGPIIVHCR